MDGSNMRIGTIMAMWDGTNITYTGYSTGDYGDTSPIVLSADINGSNVRLIATIASGTWDVKVGVILI